ncbi:PREDICTED: ninjurin-2-like [Branchiostoma belcheri]|uniref:Ninjurin-2-like n=1 Tax=Branchiostoma belcheri TaxID=7741 RepID=A0A6P4YP76_BRABE|nr:PREDICTED: ninjurin-2-like [Branchiostoma belcheri]
MAENWKTLKGWVHENFVEPEMSDERTLRKRKLAREESMVKPAVRRVEPPRKKGEDEKEEEESSDKEEGNGPKTPGELAMMPVHQQLRDMNKFTARKTMAQGFLDMALLSANASQMKYVLQVGPVSIMYYFLLFFLTISVLLQLAVALLLLLKTQFTEVEETDDEENLRNSKKMHLLNNWITALVIVTMVVNVFITAFGISPAGPPAAAAAS